MSYKKEFNFNMGLWHQGLPFTTETPKYKTPTDPITEPSSDLGATLDLMDKMERAKRRGLISFTKEFITCGLADKLLPLLNVVYQEYSPIRNHLDVYFEHESLSVVPEGCECPHYRVDIDIHTKAGTFDIIDCLDQIRFNVKYD